MMGSGGCWIREDDGGSGMSSPGRDIVRECAWWFGNSEVAKVLS